MRSLVIAVLAAGCFHGEPATQAVYASWQGRTRAEIVDRWGPPVAEAKLCIETAAEPCTSAGTVPRWSFTRIDGTLPTGFVSVVKSPGAIDFAAALQPGRVWHVTTDAAAQIEPAGTIVGMSGAALHWGPPNDVNLHWGAIFGVHAGMGRLNTTATPLPSGNAYIGGMLGPTFGLVGTATLVAGTSDAGGAMVLGGGVAAQWWPITRLWLRAGPAMVLRFDPGFMNAALRPAVETSASYAVVKIGRLAVDLSLDVGFTFVGSNNNTFGLLGVGVAVN